MIGKINSPKKFSTMRTNVRTFFLSDPARVGFHMLMHVKHALSAYIAQYEWFAM